MQKQYNVFLPLFLTGMRACGKSTLGMALAQKLGLPFVDTDEWICAQAGASVAEIVAKEGWAAFRDREAAALRVLAKPAYIVATGGGMVLRADNRAFLRKNGVCVYLHVKAEELYRRLKLDPRPDLRPSLEKVSQDLQKMAHHLPSNSLPEIQELLRERDPLYRQAASHVLSAEGGEAQKKQVLSQLEAIWNASSSVQL